MSETTSDFPRLLNRAHRCEPEHHEALMVALGLTPGDDDAPAKWASVALASVICGQAPRKSAKPNHPAFAEAPTDLRIVLEAAADHQCGIYLGNFQLRVLDQWQVLTPNAMGEQLNEGLDDWGGYAGERLTGDGVMHPTHKTRDGWHNSVENVWQILHQASVDMRI